MSYTISGYIGEADVVNANTVKELVIDALVADDLLSTSDAKRVLETYVVTVSKKTSLFRWLKSKLSKEEVKDEAQQYFISKVLRPVRMGNE